jgi:hypothetical protein
LSTYNKCTPSAITHELNVSGHMLIWTSFPVLIHGTRAQSLTGHFSVRMYDYQFPTVSVRRVMLAEAVLLRTLFSGDARFQSRPSLPTALTEIFLFSLHFPLGKCHDIISNLSRPHSIIFCAIHYSLSSSHLTLYNQLPTVSLNKIHIHGKSESQYSPVDIATGYGMQG